MLILHSDLRIFKKVEKPPRNAKDEFERALALDGTELDQGTKNSIQERLAIIHKTIK